MLYFGELLFVRIIFLIKYTCLSVKSNQFLANSPTDLLSHVPFLYLAKFMGTQKYLLRGFMMGKPHIICKCRTFRNSLHKFSMLSYGYFLCRLKCKFFFNFVYELNLKDIEGAFKIFKK